MASIGRVTGRSVEQNRDGEKNVLMLQVEITDPDDVQSVELFRQAGEDYNPPNGSQVIIVDLARAFRVGVAVDDGIEPSMNEGERKLYSIDAGAIAAFVNLLSDGVIELNGNADFAVRFSKMKEAFDDLFEQWNIFAGSYVPGTAGSGTANTATVTIDAAKIDEIKVP